MQPSASRWARGHRSGVAAGHRRANFCFHPPPKLVSPSAQPCAAAGSGAHGRIRWFATLGPFPGVNGLALRRRRIVDGAAPLAHATLARPACSTLRRLDLSDRDDVAARSGEAERLVVAPLVRLEELELCRLNTNLRLVLEKVRRWCGSSCAWRRAFGSRAPRGIPARLRELSSVLPPPRRERSACAARGRWRFPERIAIAHVPQWRCACWAFSCLRCPKATHVTLNQCGRPGPHGLQCSEDGVHESAFLDFLKRCAGSIEWIDLSGSAFRRKFPFPNPYTYPRRNDTASRLFARGADVPSLQAVDLSRTACRFCQDSSSGAGRRGCGGLAGGLRWRSEPPAVERKRMSQIWLFEWRTSLVFPSAREG